MWGILAPLFNGKAKKGHLKKKKKKSVLPLNKKQHIQTSGRSTWKYGSASFQMMHHSLSWEHECGGTNEREPQDDQTLAESQVKPTGRLDLLD